jgi:integrase
MKFMNRIQVLRVLKAAREASERDFIMILLGYRHGLRSSEVCSLHAKKHFADGYITVKRLKGSEKTSQPLFGSDDPLLDEATTVPAYLKTVSGGYLFPARETKTTASPHISRQQFHRIFRAHCETAGVPSHLRHAHTLKHSIAVELVKRIDIAELQTFLGHKSLSSTGQYLRISQQQACDAVAAAMRF